VHDAAPDVGVFRPFRLQMNRIFTNLGHPHSEKRLSCFSGNFSASLFIRDSQSGEVPGDFNVSCFMACESNYGNLVRTYTQDDSDVISSVPAVFRHNVGQVVRNVC